jgi:uncharacterized protein (TIGR02117 family)
MKKGVKIFIWSIVSIILFFGFYFLFAFFFGKIEANRNKTNKPKKYTVLILSNGVHTDIVMPVKNNLVNWNYYFPVSNTKTKQKHNQWIAFGWGDKGFYLNTPTWADLTVSTAFKAATGLSSPALHVTYRDSINIDSSNCIKLKINRQEYKDLRNFIFKSFQKNKNNQAIYIRTNAVYGDNDAFYESTGTYHLFNTCNTWTNDALKSCNQKACCWTPFESGIFGLYKN